MNFRYDIFRFLLVMLVCYLYMSAIMVRVLSGEEECTNRVKLLDLKAVIL